MNHTETCRKYLHGELCSCGFDRTLYGFARLILGRTLGAIGGAVIRLALMWAGRR